MLLAWCATLLANTGSVTIEAWPRGSTDAGLGYLLGVPAGYATSTTSLHPLVVFLPGAGEEGTGLGSLDAGDLSLMARHGPIRNLLDGSPVFDEASALVIAAQPPFVQSAAAFNGFLRFVMNTYRVDPRRIVLTGLSSGGQTVAFYSRDQSRNRLSAVMPIAAFTSNAAPVPSQAVATPTWAFHAFGDGTVPRQWTITWIDGLAAARGIADAGLLVGYPNGGSTNTPAPGPFTALDDPQAPGGFQWSPGVVTDGGATLRLTMFPENVHNAWTRAYANPDVWRWALSQARPLPAGLEQAVFVDNLERGRVTLGGSFVAREDPPGQYYGWDFAEGAGSNNSAEFTFDLPPVVSGVVDVYISSVPVAGAGIIRVSARSDAGPEASVLLDQRVDAGFTHAGKLMVGDGLVVRLEAQSGSALVVDAVAALPSIDTTAPAPPTALDVSPLLADAGPFRLSWTAGLDDLPPLTRSQTAQRLVGAPDWSAVADAGALELRTPPQEGRWEFAVRSIDRSGNTSAWVISPPVVLDLSPPTVPMGVTATATASGAMITWRPSTDTLTTVDEYEVERLSDGGVSSQARTAAVSLLDATLPLGASRWRVRARDTVGRWSDWSMASGEIDVQAALPPTVTPWTNARARCDEAFGGALEATGTAPFSWELVSGPVGLAVDSSGAVRWLPDESQTGAQTLTARVTGPGGVVTSTFTLEVQCERPDAGPVALDPRAYRIGCGCAALDTLSTIAALAALLAVRRARPRR